MRKISILLAFTALLFLVSGSALPDSICGVEANRLRLLPAGVYRDRLKGAFVGQMAGVCYGAPYEFKAEGFAIPAWMMRDWRPGLIRGALIQDDIYVELTFLETLELHGPGVSIEQIGEDFARSKYPLWHANRAGRKNIREDILPPLSGHPRHNRHADDIDFQIEADLFGLVCPGMPASVQELTWKFGHVMNYGDGVYGGVFMAAMYSAAFFEQDRKKVIEAGLAAIPGESNYARTIRDVLDAYNKDPSNWKSAWQAVESKWADKQHCPESHVLYPWKKTGIGANVNGAYVVIGLLYGEGDPMRTMTISTMCGRDADCNPASAMGVLGAITGFEKLPDSMKSGLASIRGREFAFTSYDYQGALEAMEKMALIIIEAGGGLVCEDGKGRVYGIPLQEPAVLPLEQWPYDTPASEVPLP